jgi:hypothetical protein
VNNAILVVLEDLSEVQAFCRFSESHRTSSTSDAPSSSNTKQLPIPGG